jgi:hypothetical protein
MDMFAALEKTSSSMAHSVRESPMTRICLLDGNLNDAVARM